MDGREGGAVAPLVLWTKLIGGAVAPLLLLAGGEVGGVLGCFFGGYKKKSDKCFLSDLW